jgi:phage-related protein
MNALDFYFNGHMLSEFDGMIAGTGSIKPLNLLPLKENKTEQVLGKEAWLVTNVLYNPRSFIVPVTFTNLAENIRDIAAWLNVLEPTDFYYEEDELKLKCLLDSSTANELENIGFIGKQIGATIELKFIAYDPFYYANKDAKWIFTTGTYVKTEEDKKYGIKLNQVSNFSNLTLKNNGNYKSYPFVKITGSGDITLTINSNSYTLTGVSDYIFIDSNYLTVYKDTTNEIAKLTTGDLSKLTLNPGNNTISLTGSVTCVEIICNSRWI